MHPQMEILKAHLPSRKFLLEDWILFTIFFVSVILLMVQESGVHQLRLVAYLIIYKVLYIQGGCIQTCYLILLEGKGLSLIPILINKDLVGWKQHLNEPKTLADSDIAANKQYTLEN